jgi:hypothetical protein
VPRVPLVWPAMVAAAVAVGITAARGQQDLDAGKTGPQLFAQDCVACHRSPQGLVKSMSGGSLVSFLRQHYTSSSSSAGALAGYLQSIAAAPRAPERPKAKAAEDQAARDRAKAARPAETTAAPSSTEAPGAQTPRKQREQVARPSDSPTDPHAKGSRKSRRAPAAEPAETTAPPASTEPVPTTAAAQPTAPSVQPTAPAEPVAARAAAPTGAGEAVARPAPSPGFAEPLP